MGSNGDHQETANGAAPPNGPHPSFIQLAKPYVFQLSLQQCMRDIGATPAKEDNIRLLGVAWIDNVRKALQLPVRTYNTACVYYHKFRLLHPDNEYDYRDAAAASLFNACKIEDTLKKSKDILCAAYNLRVPTSERLSSDDQLFETHSKTIVGLERLMLEASGFDFRNRYPQKMLMKLVKSCNLEQATAGLTAYKVCLDLYRTFAPVKQTTQTMALACLELAIRLRGIDMSKVTTKYGFDYERWFVTREEIMETMLDLMDLYQDHRMNSLIGQEYPLERFIEVRIELNREAGESRMPRFTEYSEVATETPKDGKQTNGVNGTNGTSSKSSTISPQSPGSMASVGARGKEGTVRFMLDPARARDEKAQVKEFFGPPREIEETIWVDVPENSRSPSLSPPNERDITKSPPDDHTDELVRNANKSHLHQPDRDLLQDPASSYSPPPADASRVSIDAQASSAAHQGHEVDPEDLDVVRMLLTKRREEQAHELQQLQRRLQEKEVRRKSKKSEGKDKGTGQSGLHWTDLTGPEQHPQAASHQTPPESSKYLPALGYHAARLPPAGKPADSSDANFEHDAYAATQDYTMPSEHSHTSVESAATSLLGLMAQAPVPMPTPFGSQAFGHGLQLSPPAQVVPSHADPPQAEVSWHYYPQPSAAAPSLAVEQSALASINQQSLASTGQKRKWTDDKPGSPANIPSELGEGPVDDTNHQAGRKQKKKKKKNKKKGSQPSIDSSASVPASSDMKDRATEGYSPMPPEVINQKRAVDSYRPNASDTAPSIATKTDIRPTSRSAANDIDSYRPSYSQMREQEPYPLPSSPMSKGHQPHEDSPRLHQYPRLPAQDRNVYASAHESAHVSAHEGPGFYIRGGATHQQDHPPLAPAAERFQDPAFDRHGQREVRTHLGAEYDHRHATLAQAPGVDADADAGGRASTHINTRVLVYRKVKGL